MQQHRATGAPTPGRPGTTASVPGLAGNVAVMAFSSGLNVGSMMLWMAVYSLILRDLGAGDLVIGLASAASMVLSALLRYVGGRLADRLGRVPLLVWPGFLAAGAIAFAAGARSWHLFVLLYAVYMGSQALWDPSFGAIIGESVPQEDRGRAFGLVEFSISAGVVVGPFVGALLLPLIGSPGLLVASGLVMFAGTCIRGLLLRETRARGRPSGPFGLRHLFRPRLLEVLGVVVLANLLFALNVWGPFLSLHAADAMQMGKAGINVLASVGSAAGLAVSFICGRAVVRWGCRRVLRLALCVLASSAYLWSLQQALSGIVGCYVLMMIAFQAAIIALDTFRVHSVDDEVRGSALGAIGMLTGLFAAPVVPLASYLRTGLGSGVPFVLGLLPAAGAFWLLGRPEAAAVQAAPPAPAGMP